MRASRTPRENVQALLAPWLDGGVLPRRAAIGGADASCCSADCAMCYGYYLVPAPATGGSGGAGASGIGTGGSGAGQQRAGAPQEDGGGWPLAELDQQQRQQHRGGQALGSEAQAETPDVCCPTPACARPFHRSCLAAWLATQPGASAAFGVLYGRCPYCGGALSVHADG